MSELLTIGEVSHLIGVVPQTLRNWDRFPEQYPDKPRPIPRASANERRKYRKSDITAYIKTLSHYTPPSAPLRQYKPRKGDVLRNPGTREIPNIGEEMPQTQLDALKRSMTKVLTSVTDVLDLVDEFEKTSTQEEGKD